MKKVLITLELALLIVLVCCNSPCINTEEIIANDLNIRIFNFNVNTLVCYDETKNGVIVDPGMSSKSEQKVLFDFITKENIVVKYIINTHPHSDHIAGNAFCVKTFKSPIVAHEAGLLLYNNAATDADVCYPKYDILIREGDSLTFGNQIWKTIYTPGHADGSICFYDEKNKLVIIGDVIFAGGIGRTDFPTGNFNQLIKNINEKLLPLGDNVLVIPGHGETTTIGNEKNNWKYIRMN
jgi:glyoxylase-like metal-dependent hydrolase (beta-lactamase superfamily II)